MADRQNTVLRPIPCGNTVPGKLLSIDDVYICLTSQIHLNDPGKKMISYMKSEPHDQLIHRNVTFPVTSLQHVTVKDSMTRILDFEYFSGSERVIVWSGRCHRLNLSYWSTKISSSDVEEAYKKAYQNVQHISNTKTFQREIKEQFANSPAFHPDSRYGNFKFSFPLCDLLTAYRDQYCDEGMEPQLRVLCTDIYKLEIAHIILVHNPGSDQFNDFQEVPSVHGSAQTLPFVYRNLEDGGLYWRPESISSVMEVKVTKDDCVRLDCPLDYCVERSFHGTCSSHKVYSVWNHLILAFHLPEKGRLKMPKQKLLDSLSPCDLLDPFLKHEYCRTTRKDAEEVIKRLKEQQV